MKNGIKEMRDALAPEDVLPNMMVVEVDDPEQYVEHQGLCVAQSINELLAGEAHAIDHYEMVIKDNLDLMSDKDVSKLKDIVAQKKANITVLQEMTTTYDEIDLGKTATQSLKKLLKRSK